MPTIRSVADTEKFLVIDRFFLVADVQKVSWAKDASSKIWTVLIYVSTVILADRLGRILGHETRINDLSRSHLNFFQLLSSLRVFFVKLELSCLSLRMLTN